MFSASASLLRERPLWLRQTSAWTARLKNCPQSSLLHKLVGPVDDTAETVCALSKLDVYQKITVDLKMDELDVTAAETKATYEEIREYVKEHTGLNVSDLYIAQVKQKCGIKERQNYNKPKAENPKRLKCPAEKERAIREALKYFKMI